MSRITFMMMLLLLHAAAVNAQVTVKDAFGRNLSGKTITLVDWEGYMANPAIKLTITPPSAPLTITISANHPRLYFDWVSSNYLPGSSGPSKTITFSNTNPVDFYLAIFPDRGAGDENYTLTITGSGTQTFPIKVIDQDPATPVYNFNITMDYSQDTRYNFYSTAINKTIVEQASKDWAYFLTSNNFDAVPANTQQTFIWNDNYTNGGNWVYNANAYTGFLLYPYGFDDDVHRSGGAPSNMGFQSRGGVATQLRRSGEFETEYQGNYNTLGWNTSITDDTWYQATNYSGDQPDLYSISMHEIGHTLSFNSNYPTFQTAKTQGYISDPEVVAYQGSTVPIDESDHLAISETTPDALKVTDRLSKRGAFGSEYAAFMPQGRWLITKLNLLIMKSMGYTIKTTSAFVPVSITTASLPSGNKTTAYNQTVVANGGVPFYNFVVQTGALPAGLTLNSFTGAITGTPTTNGTYNFTVRVTEYDNAYADKAFSITIAGVSPTVSISSPANSASFTAPASITINATAAETGGTISKVEFYNGATLLGTDLTSPYSYTWSSVAAGSYSLTAKAYDNQSPIVNTTSAVVNVTVTALVPVVSISSPANNATFTAPASITINATASETGGSINKVEFYNGSTLLGTDLTSPYSYTWSSVAAGSYNLTAKAYDNQSTVVTKTSSIVAITVTASGGTCTAPAWVSTTAYTSPMTVQYLGIKYQANFWTQGDTPSTHNGGAGSGQPWTSLGTCTSRIGDISSEAETNNSLSVYPNPVTNASVISVDLNSDDEIEIILSDLTGKNIGTLYNGSLAQGTHLIPVDHSSLLPGRYLVRMKGASHSAIVSFIKY